MSCQIYTMSGSDTCASVSLAFNISIVSFIGFNPNINAACSNTNLNSSIVCVSPPMGTYTLTPIAGLTPTNAAEYTEETVVPPGITAADTMLNCGKWILVQAGDYCQALSLSNSISLDLFYLINPSIHKPACDNLIPGLYYCAQPMYRWKYVSPSQQVRTLLLTVPPASPMTIPLLPFLRLSRPQVQPRLGQHRTALDGTKFSQEITASLSSSPSGSPWTNW